MLLPVPSIRKAWTKRETELLREFDKEGFTSDVIAERLNRTETAVRVKLVRLKDPEKRKEQRARDNARRKLPGHSRYAGPVTHKPVQAFRAADKTLAEREYRLGLEPTSLTALICGDPAPGYSALDRR